LIFLLLLLIGDLHNVEGLRDQALVLRKEHFVKHFVQRAGTLEVLIVLVRVFGGIDPHIVASSAEFTNRFVYYISIFQKSCLLYNIFNVWAFD
jgi:hypothetical protein